MPSKLPVPSKGALRALRNIALGTSCTIAFSAGMLTEDRRRRIHTAKQVYDNGKKLRNSSHYRESSTLLGERFEEHVLRDRNEGLEFPGSSGVGHVQTTAEAVGDEQLDRRKTVAEFKVEPRIPFSPVPIGRVEPPEIYSREKVHNDPIVDDRQTRLAFDIQQILEHMKTEKKQSRKDKKKNRRYTVNAAVLRLCEAFDEGVDMESGIQSCLLDVMATLSRTCYAQGRKEDMEKILDILLLSGTIRQEDFDRLSPDIVVESLLKKSINDKGELASPELLRKAVALYLTEFDEDPIAIAPTLSKFGTRLCEDTCRLGMHKLTIDVHNRTKAANGHVADEAIASFIVAAHNIGLHKDVVSYFFSHFVNTQPSQQAFWDVVNAVVESAITQEKYDKYDEVEAIMVAVLKMGKAKNLQVTTTVFLRLLGLEWRASRNIFLTRARFNRLEPLLSAVSHPLAAYSAIIQFCIEAKDITSAERYRTRMVDKYGECDDVRINGHFALVKAMRKDWDGVNDDFAHMAQLNPHKETYGAVFTPILKLFVKSHSLVQMEEFLRPFLETYQVPLTSYIFNVVIDEYAKAKELDSIARWIEYATSLSNIVDATTFNTTLNQLHKTWKFNFEWLYQIYLRVKELAPACTNDVTLAILKQIAISESNGDWSVASRKLSHSPCTYDSPPNTRSIRLTMVEALTNNDPATTLQIYKQNLESGGFIHPAVLGAAVKAALISEMGEIDGAVLLLQEAKQKGIDLNDGLITLLSYQIPKLERNHQSSYLSFVESAKSAINAVESHGITIPTFVFTDVVSMVVKKGHYTEAIEFWNTFSRNRGSSIRLDLVALTVLLKAYVGIRDAPGVTWVMTMLSVNNLHPDVTIKMLLKNTRKSLRLIRPKTRFHEVVDEAYECCKDMRAASLKENVEAKQKTIEIMKNAAKSQREAQGDVER